MKIQNLTLLQCQRIIDNDFASIVGQSNDKYVNYKDEIMSHYYQLLDKKQQLEIKERSKVKKHGTDYRGYRVIAIKHEEGYSFNLYKLNKKSKIFTSSIPIRNLTDLVGQIDQTVHILKGRYYE